MPFNNLTTALQEVSLNLTNDKVAFANIRLRLNVNMHSCRSIC